jgi:hypothetical protein
MTLRRRNIEVFSLSILDVISCGFGAIILLLVISLALEPATVARLTDGSKEEVEALQKEREQIQKESRQVNDDLASKQDALTQVTTDRDARKVRLSEITPEDPTDALSEHAQKKGSLEAAIQSLTEEMKRLREADSYQRPSDDAIIGGIPVDSEYIAFVIDTSGSMNMNAWPAVMNKVEEVLSVYPNVKGLQVVNDEGAYMFSGYAGKWIPDTPGRRREVVRQLRNWKPWSDSDPTEGIRHILRTYARTNARISIYVFGDDFDPNGSVEGVVQEVLRANKSVFRKKAQFRIHAFGFPVQGMSDRRSNFANLMRHLAQDNMGSFVGLTSLAE